MIGASPDRLERIMKHWDGYDYERRKAQYAALQEQPRPVPFKHVPAEVKKEIAELYKTHPASFITQKYNIRTNTVKVIARSFGVVKRESRKRKAS